MGPPPFGSGNVTIGHRKNQILAPSMGPPPFGSGNLPQGDWTGDDVAPSMGPPPFGSGNTRESFKVSHDRIPSMGPPPFGSGNQVATAGGQQVLRPSMGPPPFGSGNTARVGETASFTFSLQWGHRLSAVETIRSSTNWAPAPRPFNGATAFRQWKLGNRVPGALDRLPLQWGHRLSAVETLIRSLSVAAFQAFNGATAFRQWKLASNVTMAVDVLTPSMGPPPFGSGNNLGTDWTLYIVSAFNGATAFRQWKHSARHNGLVSGKPSMGPPPFGSGNIRRVTMASSRANLQWGHRLSAVETFGASQWPRLGQTFNGATAFRQWKRDDRHVVHVHGQDPSMGPPPFGSGNSPLPQPLCGPPCAFNGATAFRQWKHAIAARLKVEVLAFNGATAFRQWKRAMTVPGSAACANLQWGHRLSAVETPRRGGHRLPAHPFNGATAFRQWKLPSQPVGVHPLLHIPSMGPPPFGSGNESVPGLDDLVGAPSMGPPPFGSGNPIDLNFEAIQLLSLQWGHRLSAVETCPPNRPTR